MPQGSLAHVAETYRRLRDGQSLINIADPARGYRMPRDDLICGGFLF